MSEPLIRDVSDTARWMAVYRARETERPDAVFRDPFARALAGERGERIAAAMSFADDNAWSFVARTWIFDRIVARQVQEGCDLVLNLAAGLDTRPYRMDLPPSLRWIETDLPEILDYKEQVLGGAQPRCALERVRLDLSNPDARRGLFNRVGRTATRALVLSEGLLIYLMRHEVVELAQDLAAPPGIQRWAADIVSPGLLEMMRERLDRLVAEAGAPFLFAPVEGPEFFTPYGWTPASVRSLMKAASKIERLPLALRMYSLLQESNGPQGHRPWAAVCLLTRSSAAH
jgi:methyltransferase (TIGR00027 family)